MKNYTIQASIDALEKKVANAGSGGDIEAENVIYDPTTSGLTATNVQAAIDELVGTVLGGDS